MSRSARFARCAAAVSASLFSVHAFANSGTQLPLNQFQAGTENTDSSLITNPGFESVAGNIPTGWTQNGSIMISSTPDAAHLPNPPSVIGARSAQAFNPAGVDPFNDYKFTQIVNLVPNTDYVLSAYIWSYGSSGPPPQNDFFAGDLAVVEFVEPNNPANSGGIILEPTAKDGGSGAGGYFVYKTFNSGKFVTAANPSGQAQLEVELDPNQDLNFAVNRPPLTAQWDNIAVTPLTQFAVQKFSNTAGGDYNAATNWVNGPANAVNAIASFVTDAPSLATVTQNSAFTLGAVNFNANGGFAISGAGTLTLAHEEAFDAVYLNNLKSSNAINNPIVVQAGTTNLAGMNVIVPRQIKVNVANANGVLTAGGGINAANVGTLGTGSFDITKTGPGQFDVRDFEARQLTISQGTVRVLPNSLGAQRVRAGTLSIAGGTTPTAKLDVTTSAVVVDYTGASPLATIKAQILAGYGGGSFNGNGIVTQQGAGYAVGYAEASQLSSVPAAFGTVDSTAVLLLGTLAGDANLTGNVNINDFALLAANFGAPGEWRQGDFNYSGTVNINDFALLAANFGRAAADVGARGAAVPEPASAVVLAAAGLAARRRKQQ